VDGRDQGGQIGGFAQWMIVYFGILKNTEIAHDFGPLCFKHRLYINFDKNWAGLHFGDFFTNSSGHPGRDFLIALDVTEPIGISAIILLKKLFGEEKFVTTWFPTHPTLCNFISAKNFSDKFLLSNLG
jgi:hypothetical protein